MTIPSLPILRHPARRLPLAALVAAAALALPAGMAAAGALPSPGPAAVAVGALALPAAWRDRDGTPPGNGNGPGIVPGPAPVVGPSPDRGVSRRGHGNGAVDDAGDLNAPPAPAQGGARRGAIAPGGGANGGINGGDVAEAGHRPDSAAAAPDSQGAACVPLARARQPACR